MKNNYPDSLTIQQYLEGKLDPEMMHQLEKQALDDPFLWEALEGFSNASDPCRDLSILQRQLHERIVHKQENKKLFDLSWQRLSIAAAAAVLFISAGILFWMSTPKSNSGLASRQKQVEVQLMDTDSISGTVPSSANPALAAKDLKSGTSGSDDHASASVVQRKGKGVVSDQPTLSAYNPPVNQSMSAPVAGRIASESKVRDATLSEAEVRTEHTVQPGIGWQLYRQYLEQNTRYPKNQPILRGTVLLSFQVEKDGKLSNIKVIKGINDAYNAEAVRLVTEGPLWKGVEDGLSKEITLEIVF